MSSIQILLADDDKNSRDEARLLLQARSEWCVIGEASDGLETVQKAEELRPDVFVMDVSLPDLNGIETARRIKHLFPDSKIVFLSLDHRSDVVDIALDAGAQGFVDKKCIRNDLLPAIEAVLRGQQFVSSILKVQDRDHSHFEELAALLAGGFLSTEEHVALSEHTKECVECRTTQDEFNRLVRSELPQTVGPVREFLDKVKTRPDKDIRPRFLRRAKMEGIALSPGVEGLTRHQGRRVRFTAVAATAFAATIVMVIFYATYGRSASSGSLQAQQQVDQLKQENLALTTRQSQLSESIATQLREIDNLRSQLGNLAKADGQLARGAFGQPVNSNAKLLDEFQNQEKLLADARDEVARISELRAYDEASLVAQQTRIAELSVRLRLAQATLDMERQLAAAGDDVRELMVARQLHVIDVRDTDSNGNRSKSFGRVFLTEGKSLTFYAFDLNRHAAANASSNFQVWAVPESNKNSSLSLGALNVDAEGQGRWVLKVDKPELVMGIDSVFVTAEPALSGRPNGQKMLYAYLGEANHP